MSADTGPVQQHLQLLFFFFTFPLIQTFQVHVLSFFFVLGCSASVTFLLLLHHFATHIDIIPLNFISASIHYLSSPLPLPVSLIERKAFVIGQYLYQVGPSATWDNGLQSDPGHSRRNPSLPLRVSLQSSQVHLHHN